MQGAWGWDTFKTNSSEAPTRPWQGQWESHGCGESSGWETSTWDQLSKGDNSHYEEFENVMRWDDSGAQEAFEIATKIQERSFKGSGSFLSLPSPDLYIQVIDWDSHEDLKLPDSAETFSGERTGQRKRGRKGGAFRRQFDRQDFTSAADQKESGKPFSDPTCFNDLKAQGDHTIHHGSSNAPALDGPLDSSQRDGLPCQLQSPVQDRSRSNWSARWSSQAHQKQNFASSNWQDHGRSNWDEGRNMQTHEDRHRWQQANVSSKPMTGWARGGVPHRSSHGFLNDPCYQSTPAMQISNSGNRWMWRGEANPRGFPQQSMTQFNRGSKERYHVPTNLPDNSSGRWRQQQEKPPHHPWQ